MKSHLVPTTTIDTDRFSATMRAKAIDLKGRRVLVSRLAGSQQEEDLTEPPNCRGLGRIRHFRRNVGSNWPNNPLPIDPACRSLGLCAGDEVRAQVFQSAACNWRCWYCFVDFDLLSANHTRADWATSEELIDLYLAEPGPPSIIDLTGGQPDLTPEWVPWMMDALERRGLSESVYLWSDDNLSNDYFWRNLDEETRRRIARYPRYGRVCCFKGYNAESFAFNTMASPDLFDRQFDLVGRLVGLGLDLYAYVTFTTPNATSLDDDMSRFVDRLQEVDSNLPLRTVPLEIQTYTPVLDRLNEQRTHSIELQRLVVSRWNEEIQARFSVFERQHAICDVPLRQGRAG